MEQLTITEKIGANYVLLELSGALNSYTITEFKTKVFSYIADQNVVLDMSQIIQVDSSGLSVIMAGFNDGLDYGTKLYLMNLSEPARRAIESTGFADTFNYVHSVTEII